MILIPGYAKGEEKPIAKASAPYGGPDLAECPSVGDDYFADAVFIGDSMTDDMDKLGLFPEADFVCQIGMSTNSAMYHQFRVRGQEEKDNVPEAVARLQPGKIYVWLGSNGLPSASYSKVMEDYVRFLDELIRMNPDALIYVITPPSTSAAKMKEKSAVPGRYRLFCEELRELAQERHLYLIDYYTMTVDADGYFSKRYVSTDGYHPNRTGYTLLSDYIHTHIADPELP